MLRERSAGRRTHGYERRNAPVNNVLGGLHLRCVPPVILGRDMHVRRGRESQRLLTDDLAIGFQHTTMALHELECTIIRGGDFLGTETVNKRLRDSGIIGQCKCERYLRI